MKLQKFHAVILVLSLAVSGLALAAPATPVKLDQDKSVELFTMLANSKAPAKVKGDLVTFNLQNVWCRYSRYLAIPGKSAVLEGFYDIKCAYDVKQPTDAYKSKKQLTQSISLNTFFANIEALNGDCAMGKCYVGVKKLECSNDSGYAQGTTCTLTPFDNQE